MWQMFEIKLGTARVTVYIWLEIQKFASVPVFIRAWTTSRLGPSTGKNVERLDFIFNVYTVKISRAVLLFWIYGPCFIRAVPQVGSNVNGASVYLI